MLDFKANAGGPGVRSDTEHLRVQRDERWLDSRGFPILQPNPFMGEVGIEAVTQGDVGDGGARFGTLLDDLGFEGFAVGAALRVHGISA